MQIDSKTAVLGLFGNPSRHSLSPVIQNYFLNHYKINSVYLTFEPGIEDIKKVFESAMNLGFTGLNITMPFKEEVFKLLDHAEGAARVIKAVNTVKFEYSKKGKPASAGFSTDGEGVIKSLKDMNFTFNRKTCILIGAGGAARSAVLSIVKKPVNCIYVFDIVPRKAQDLAKLISSSVLGAEGKIRVLNDIEKDNKIFESANLIMNCSPAGMHMDNNGRNEKKIPVPDWLSLKDKYVFDMVYNPAETCFLKKARNDGAKGIIPGIDMLVNQAAFSFKIWFGIMPEYKAIAGAKRKLSVFFH